MPFSGKRKYPYKFTIYVPPEKERTVKRFIELFQARDESASQKLIDYMEDYVMNNKPVNPQTRLDQILQRPVVLCGCGKEARWDFRVIEGASLKTEKVCDSCLSTRKRSTRKPHSVKKLKTYEEIP